MAGQVLLVLGAAGLVLAAARTARGSALRAGTPRAGSPEPARHA